ncbi:MAG: DUF898 family protein [Hyphomicrobium sp.]|nr:DUF898 family protein [Hyphomicrobium sp.]
MDQVSSGPTPGPRTALSLSWLHPRGLVGLSLVNTFLRIVTLGIYGFWAKTEVRKRLWSGVRLNGEPLVYTGTGKELFIGFLVVFLLFVLPSMLMMAGVSAAFGPESPAFGIVLALFYLAVFFLLGIAVYRATRYRMSRTSWRGIRGSLVGSDMAYAWTSFWTGLLIPLTLGWIMPWRAVKLQKILTDDMRFGSAAFRFEGGSGPLYAAFAVFWIGLIAIFAGTALLVTGGFGLDLSALPQLPGEGEEPTEEQAVAIAMLGLAIFAAFIVGSVGYAVLSAWYSAQQFNHFARSTTLDGLRFEGQATGAGLIWIALSNFFILAAFAIVAGLVVSAIVIGVTHLFVPFDQLEADQATGLVGALAQIGVIIGLACFGVLLPVTQARSTRYLVERLAVSGELDGGAIAQGQDQGIGRGEGLAQALDFDAI